MVGGSKYYEYVLQLCHTNNGRQSMTHEIWMDGKQNDHPDFTPVTFVLLNL
jgi:uncharacterized short protein YbdD (DUF466 family)